MEFYENSRQHLWAELERIDPLIQAEVWRARQVPGLYIPEGEGDFGKYYDLLEMGTKV